MHVLQNDGRIEPATTRAQQGEELPSSYLQSTVYAALPGLIMHNIVPRQRQWAFHFLWTKACLLAQVEASPCEPKLENY